MKLSTKGCYGIDGILDIASHGKGKPVVLKDIAHRQKISKKYLEHIMRPLVASGLVQSVRGTQGGFCINKSPKEIKLSELMQVLEGSIAPISCVDNPKLCKRSELCVTREIWAKMKKAILEILESITLQDIIVLQEKKKSRPDMPDYII